jgi:UDP-2-acetamido-3-amino-2,3-dideoxy-glucuronate N-acetyltransferase
VTFFVHPDGRCETDAVGEGTRVWAFAHVLPGAVIGRDCNICNGVFIENDVVVGDRVTVKCGVQLWDGVTLADDVFVGPNATFTNDLFPRSKSHERPLLRTVVATGASVGANATILPGLTIGAMAMVGAGSVVTRDVPPGAIVRGNPARITGYVDALRRDETFGETAAGSGEKVTHSSLPGVTIHRLRVATDLRGSLSACEFDDDLPFVVRRSFIVYDVPSKDVRGAHAHRECAQFLWCAKGSVSVVADNGVQREEFLLDNPGSGLHLPSMVWGIQYKFSTDAVLLVLASLPYDSADYIRDYDEFLRQCRSSTEAGRTAKS